VLEEQVPQRRHLAALPRAGWRGRYGEAFGGARVDFDADGRPVSAQRGPGTTVRFVHDGEHLVEMAHQGGRRLRWEWDDERVAALACSEGARVTYR
jgi:YD repeat-containing protein